MEKIRTKEREVIVTRMVLGAFETERQADNAIQTLEDLGYTRRDISIITREREVRADETEGVGEGAASGAAAGGAIGGLAGLLAGLGVLPGLAGLFVGGPIALALGATGVIATTISGAVTGAVAGGLIGALMNLGVPEEEARRYGEVVESGGVLVGVPVGDRNVDDIRRVFEDHDAQGVSEMEMKETEPHL